MKNWKWSLALAVGFLILGGAVAQVLLGHNKKADESMTYTDRGLPVIDIDLKGVTLEEFKEGDKDYKYADNSVAIYDGNEDWYYSDVEIKGRGNTTWLQDKKPFQIKFRGPNSLLGMNKAKKWVFLANRLDASDIRTDVAFKVAEMVGADYVNRGRFAEVYFDGEYEGLYYILPRVEIGKGSVDIRNPGGVLVELDNIHRAVGEKCHISYSGNCLIVKDVVVTGEENPRAAEVENFVDDFNRLEMASESGDFATVSEVADIDSLVRYFLINEFTVNFDAYSTSFYLYRDGDDDKIHAGPVWDFDLALANREWVWYDDEEVFSPTEIMVRRQKVLGEDGSGGDEKAAKLMYHLMDMPEFRAEVRRVFNEKMKGRGQELTIAVEGAIGAIREAAEADTLKWDKDDFDSETQALLDWVKARYEYFEQVYGDDGDEAPGVI